MRMNGSKTTKSGFHASACSMSRCNRACTQRSRAAAWTMQAGCLVEEAAGIKRVLGRRIAIEDARRDRCRHRDEKDDQDAIAPARPGSGRRGLSHREPVESRKLRLCCFRSGLGDCQEEGRIQGLEAQRFELFGAAGDVDEHPLHRRGDFLEGGIDGAQALQRRDVDDEPAAGPQSL